ncbi:mas-related G-protein coupled receptor member X3-like [Urocitellus parryii]
MNEKEQDSSLYFTKDPDCEVPDIHYYPVVLAGNATVLWFCMCRNSFSVYILNLASVDFLFLCCHIVDTLLYFAMIFYFSVNRCTNIIIYFLTGSFRQQLLQWPRLQLFVQGALQDSPEENECGDSLSQEALEMSGSRGDGDEDQTDWL